MKVWHAQLNYKNLVIPGGMLWHFNRCLEGVRQDQSAMARVVCAVSGALYLEGQSLLFDSCTDPPSTGRNCRPKKGPS